jgi:hypothetical protein
MVEPNQPESPVVNPAVQHERTDVNVHAIVWFALIMIGLGVVIHVALWWLFKADMAHEEEIKRSSFPLAAGTRHLPPEPRLEQIDRVEKSKSPNAEQRPPREDGYGRIPIERAMSLLAGKLPVRPLPAKKKEKP